MTNLIEGTTYGIKEPLQEAFSARHDTVWRFLGINTYGEFTVYAFEGVSRGQILTMSAAEVLKAFNL